jgi:predicted amidohydrolase
MTNAAADAHPGRALPIAVVQQPPVAVTEPFDTFADSVRALLRRFPRTRLVAYPELHLFGVDSARQLVEAAEPIDGPRVKALAELAGELGVWLLPGSLAESDDEHPGQVFNTAVAFSPEGELAASYRKIFPWRPYELFAPGDQFVVFDLPGVGRCGFSICYDAWFPEVSRQLAWMGAEVIINPTQTSTSDRAQELVLARANAIVNQVFVISVNAAAPVGVGGSLVVDPEGRVRVSAENPSATVLTDVIDLDDVRRVREFGTAGLNRLWDQFSPDNGGRDTDPVIELPLYSGRIDPKRWKPTT